MLLSLSLKPNISSGEDKKLKKRPRPPSAWALKAKPKPGQEPFPYRQLFREAVWPFPQKGEETSFQRPEGPLAARLVSTLTTRGCWPQNPSAARSHWGCAWHSLNSLMKNQSCFLGTTDKWRRSLFVVGGHVVLCRKCSLLLDLQQSHDLSSLLLPAPVVTARKVSRYCHMPPGGELPWLRTIAINSSCNDSQDKTRSSC